ncbi:pimeloyl-ACP methyl ester carboxylesterase [Salsuginibacillus halophilus]|uniref:Pimeloyl-ACP methyl ester carboxylesterase n=1 Tax=Salsuginibacillus halophilus TaxID=517424 RepID=A0A2P8HHY6_9BACI|nr:alpha/beta hydrolase [Salsuginibacillus halophilus]PSL45833.1 pimeloyl-ACP methyl ester carboxylesterase [Salsuginibacillus halophilus]
MAEVISRGTRLTYSLWGQGPALGFFHPPAMGAVTFWQQHPLRANHRLLLLNARGHGGSESGAVAVTLAQWAEDMKHAADQEGIDRLTLVGYSNGGMAALTFAQLYPERTKGLVLVGGFPEAASFLLQKEFELGLQVANHAWMNLLGSVLGAAHTSHPGHRQAIRQTVAQADPLAVKALYQHSLSVSVESALDELKVPVTLVYGTGDKYVHGYQLLFEKGLAPGQLETVLVGGVMHQVPTRQPAALNAILSDFESRRVL